MIDPSWSHREFNTLFGAVTKGDQRNVPLPHAVVANNCEFYSAPQDEQRGDVSKRYGFGSTGVATTVAHTALYDWIANFGHYVVYWSTAGAIAQEINGAATTLTLSNSATGVSFARGGNRLYMALFGSTGYGSTQGRVVLKDSSGTLRMDALFPAPITYAPSAPSEPGAGEVTAGLHRFGYIIEYRSGFFGRLQPDNGTGTPGIDDTFAPVEFTAAGSMSLRWVLNTTWPANAVRVHVAMSPVSNPNLYILVPDAEAAVTGGVLSSHTINFNVNDADLLNFLETGDVTENRLLYTQVVAGTGPHNPSAAFEYSDRLVYVTRIADSSGNLESCALVSARNKYEHVTLSRHKLNTAIAPDLRTGFTLNKELFLLSPNGTFATRDNGQDPVRWPSLRTVNGQRGTEAVNGFAVNPDEGYAWVATRSGLFLFDGSQYADSPVSEGCAEWDTIRWDLAQEIHVKDDPANQRVYVAAPLSGTSGDLTILCFSYHRGKTPGKVDFSKWTFTETDFKIGAIEMVVSDWTATPNTLKKRMELNLISGAAASRRILRQMGSTDTNPYRDYRTDAANQAITWAWRGAPFKDGRSFQVIRHEAVHIRLFGSGTVTFKAYSLDAVQTYTKNPIVLSATPGQEILRSLDIAQDGLMLEFSNAAIDQYATVGGFRYYWQSAALLR